MIYWDLLPKLFKSQVMLAAKGKLSSKVAPSGPLARAAPSERGVLRLLNCASKLKKNKKTHVSLKNGRGKTQAQQHQSEAGSLRVMDLPPPHQNLRVDEDDCAPLRMPRRLVRRLRMSADAVDHLGHGVDEGGCPKLWMSHKLL